MFSLRVLNLLCLAAAALFSVVYVASFIVRFEESSQVLKDLSIAPPIILMVVYFVLFLWRYYVARKEVAETEIIELRGVGNIGCIVLTTFFLVVTSLGLSIGFPIIFICVLLFELHMRVYIWSIFEAKKYGVNYNMFRGPSYSTIPGERKKLLDPTGTQVIGIIEGAPRTVEHPGGMVLDVVDLETASRRTPWWNPLCFWCPSVCLLVVMGLTAFVMILYTASTSNFE